MLAIPLREARRIYLKPDRSLSRREQEVLELVSLGLPTEEIAAQLFLSRQTIKTHRKSLFHKLGIRNSAHLVRVAFERGLLT